MAFIILQILRTFNLPGQENIKTVKEKYTILDIRIFIVC